MRLPILMDRVALNSLCELFVCRVHFGLCVLSHHKRLAKNCLSDSLVEADNQSVSGRVGERVRGVEVS